MIGVVGYGRSGKAVAGLIERQGEVPFISERNENISDIPYPSELGGHTEKLLEMDIIIVSPGIPLNLPILQEAQRVGISVMGELEFASRYLKGTIVAITGTNGKTTTAALIEHILSESKRFKKVFLGGNILPGTPLSDLVEGSDQTSITVIEVSSFQLERIIDFHPNIAVITNISEDHLDRYNTFADYRNAKLKIFKNQTESDYSILNGEDVSLQNLDIPSHSLYFSMKEKADMWFNGKMIRDRENKAVFSPDDLFLPEEIFIKNGMAATLVVSLLGLEGDEVREGIRSFKGVEHRMEWVINRNGLQIINNSMCTNPTAFLMSLKAFPDSCVIVGGRMKVFDITPIIKAIHKWAREVVLLGESSDFISRELQKEGFDRYRITSSMMDAVMITKDYGNKRIILSPGGASFDLYKDFTERGKAFKEAVRRIYGE
ncbi:UDP-N-acetylmuramoyl-L-alanine--D-glutamate ligase [candidate division WOR-3 bacterium]|nr:UDP-N-acetylmuramoyl-L-alanine--D-glutamate ligase [candidate division WOR-3 bacterium]